MNRRLVCLAAAAATAALLLSTEASAVMMTWINPVGGMWGPADNWDPQNCPESAGESATIGVPGTYTVTLDVSPNIDSLTISNPNATLDFPGGRVLTLVSGPHFNDGLMRLNINSSANDAILHFATSSLIDGTGEVRLLDDDSDATLSSAAGAVLTNAASHTISGTGEIPAELINQGLISADISGGTLDLLGFAKTNNGIMQAAGGGVLDIHDVTITQSGDGRIVADGGVVRFPSGTNASVIGGSLETLNGGAVDRYIGTAALQDVTNEGQFNILGAGQVHVFGMGLTNNGTISINPNSSANDAILHFANSGLLGGIGNVRLLDDDSDATLSSAAGAVMTNAASHTISGTGEIPAELINQGSISADVNGGTLELLGFAKTNHGIMEAVNGGILDIHSVTITQSNDGRIVADGGTVRFPNGTNASVIGGSFETLNDSVVVREGGTAALQEVTNEGQFNIHGAGQVHVFGGGLTNNGMITINSNHSANDALLHFATSGVLGGFGEVRLFDDDSDATLSSAAGAVLTNAVSHTISGTGEVAAEMINDGWVTADMAGQRLELLGFAKTNNGIMEAVNGGILSIHDTTVTQTTGGTILADGGIVRFPADTNATVIGGSFATLNSGVVERYSGTAALQDVTNEGQFDIHGAGQVNVFGSGLTNNGTITINSNHSANDALLHFATSGVLGGLGEVRLFDDGPDAQVTSAAGAVLTNDMTHTIAGTGEVRAELINDGWVIADVPDRALELLSGPKTNHGIMEAVNGGVLSIHTTTVTQTGTATMVADGGIVEFPSGTNASVIGGSLASMNGGVVVRAGSGTVTLTGVTTAGQFNIQGAGQVHVTGSGLTNNGTITINSNHSGNDAFLHFASSGVLGGFGEVWLFDDGPDAQVTSAAGAVLTNAITHTIRGTGQMHGEFVNEGTMAPGLSHGVLPIFGTFTQAPTGVLEFEVGGLTAGSQYDRLSVSGTATLDGTAIVSITDEFVPVLGNTFDLMTATTLTGRFADLVLEGYILPAPLEAQFVYTATAARLIIDILGDADNDFDVDIVDFHTFATCYSGPNVTTPPGACTADQFSECDLDNDGDVDLVDFASFTGNFTNGGGPE